MKHLGGHLDSSLKSHIRILYFQENIALAEVLKKLYLSLVQSRLEYKISCWGSIFDSILHLLAQKIYVKTIFLKEQRKTSRSLFGKLKVLLLRHLYLLFCRKNGNLPKL